MHPVDNAFRPVPRTGVIYVMNEAARRGFHYGHADWVNLGQGAPETGALEGAPPRLTTASLDAASSEYAPVPGTPDLREAVAALYNHRYRRGMKSQYSADNVAIAAGGRAALTRLAASLGGVHLGHVLPDYTAYEELLAIFRAFVPIPISLHADEGFTLSASRLQREIRGAGLGAMLLSNPCNPTGVAVRGEQLDGWVSTARGHGCALILDEFYAHYLYGEDAPTASSAAAFVEDVDADPVVIVDGLTKNWRYPGLRLSWTVGPRSVIERVASAGSFLDGGAPHLLQRAAVPLLEPDHAEAEARSIQRAFTAKRDFALARLATMGLTDVAPCGGAFYLFVNLGGLPAPLCDGMAFFEAALEAKVICVPGAFFDVDPGKRREHLPSRLQQFVRLSFGPSMSELATGLDRLEAVIDAAR